MRLQCPGTKGVESNSTQDGPYLCILHGRFCEPCRLWPVSTLVQIFDTLPCLNEQHRTVIQQAKLSIQNLPHPLWQVAGDVGPKIQEPEAESSANQPCQYVNDGLGDQIYSSQGFPPMLCFLSVPISGLPINDSAYLRYLSNPGFQH